MRCAAILLTVDFLSGCGLPVLREASLCSCGFGQWMVLVSDVATADMLATVDYEPHAADPGMVNVLVW